MSDARPTSPPGQRTALFVASTGGHLAELVHLQNRFLNISAAVWVTPESPQSRQLIGTMPRINVPEVRPRDVPALLRATQVASHALEGLTIDLVVSTGAGLALAVLPQTALRGVETHFIESAARVTSVSLTGKLLSAIPQIQMWTQYPFNANHRWGYFGSIFDQYRVRTRAVDHNEPLRVVVTVGTMHRYSFLRLIQAVQNVLPQDAKVVWQAGSKDLQSLRLTDLRAWIPPHELTELMQHADVVIAHAGVGSALAAMRAGAFPILVPRRAAYAEHVDDHQHQIGSHLAALGLAFAMEAEDLNLETIEAARRLRVTLEPADLPLSRGRSL